MDQQAIIAEIEDLARFAGVPIATVCKRAGVHPTTFSRWKLSRRNPEPMGANLASIRKLYEALGELQAERDRAFKARRKVIAA